MAPPTHLNQIEKSRASYQAVDQTHADSLKKLDGK